MSWSGYVSNGSSGHSCLWAVYLAVAGDARSGTLRPGKIWICFPMAAPEYIKLLT